MMLPEKLLRQRFVHRDRAAQISSASIPDAEQIERSLNLSVFPVGTVQGQEDKIRVLAEIQNVRSEKFLSGCLDLRQLSVKTSHIGGRPVYVILLHEQFFIHLGNLHAAENIHQKRLMSLFPKRFTDHRAGHNGYLAFRTRSTC